MRGVRHGMYQTPTYNSWSTMVQRCTNPKATDYACYGGRRIAVCARWRKFERFFEDMGIRPEGMTLDRINLDGDYEPANCRWSDAHTQQNNKSTSVRVMYAGRVMTVKEAAKLAGISLSSGYATLERV